MDRCSLEVLPVMFEKKISTITLMVLAICGLSSYIISMESEYNIQEDIEPVDEAYPTPKQQMHEHTPKPVEELDRQSTPEEMDISKLTPEDIENLDIDINKFTPEQLSKLSPAQTEVINAGTLSNLNRFQFLALPTKYLNPSQLSIVFNYPNNKDILPDSFVQELTQPQAQAILVKPSKNLDTYFTTKQIKQIKNIAAGQPSDFNFVEKNDGQEPMPTNKPSWWRKLSSTLSSMVDGLVKQFSRSSSLSIASDAMRQYARGSYNPDNDQAVDHAFRKLTTKQKDGVANDWLVQTKAIFAEKNRILEQDISRLSKITSMSHAARDEQIASLRMQIARNNQDLEEEINKFTQKMDHFLSTDEKLIALKNGAGMIRLECIDMSEIDPTKSIEAQRQQLKIDGIINTYDANWWQGTTASIDSQTVQNLYVKWISDAILKNFNPYKYLNDEIKYVALKLTKHEWGDFDRTMAQAILDRVTQSLKARTKIDEPAKEQKALKNDIDTLTKDLEKMNSTSSNLTDQEKLDQMVKQNGFLNIPAELIPDIDIARISSLKPQDFSQATDQQIHALTRGQIRYLKRSQLAVIVPRLTSRQLSYVAPEEIEALLSQQEIDTSMHNSTKDTQSGFLRMVK